MTRPIPISQKQKLRLNKKNRRTAEGAIVAPAIYPSRRAEFAYRKDLNQLINEMVKDVRNVILPFLKQNQKEFVQDVDFSMSLRSLLMGLKRKYRDITPVATRMATEAVSKEAQDNQKKFTAGVEKFFGDDLSLQSIIQSSGMRNTLESQIAQNVDLIQSVPDEFYKKLSTLLYQGTAEGQRVGNLVKEISTLAGVTRSRAKLIARDQIQKTNSLIAKQRQTDLGVEEYVWQTAEDGDRVRETHRVKNGKTFRWDSPPADTGHPGHDINCRCVARAIIPRRRRG